MPEETTPECEKPGCVMNQPAEEVCPVEDCDAKTPADCEQKDCPVEAPKDCKEPDCPTTS